MLGAVQGVSYGQSAYLSVYASRRVSAQTGAVRPAAPDTPVQAVEPVRVAPKVEPVSEHPQYLRRWNSDPVSMAVRSRMEYMDDAALAKLRDQAGSSFAESIPAKAYAAGAATLPKAAQSEAAAALSKQNAAAQTAALPQTGFVPDAAARSKAAAGVPAQGKAAAALPGQTQAGSGASPAQGVRGAEKSKSAREVMEEAECQTCKERKYQDGSDDPGVSFKTAAHIAPELAASKVRGHEMEHVVRERASAAREDRKVVSQSVTYHTAICPECGKAYVSGGTTRTTTAANRDAFAVSRGGQKEQGGFSGFSALI